MELDEILKHLKIVSEEKFVSMSKEEWMARIDKQVDSFELHPNDADELARFANPETREKLLINSVIKASAAPPDPSIEGPPPMKLDAILSTLTMKEATFLTISKEEWDKNVPKILSSRPKPTNKDEQEELDNLEKFLYELREVNARREFFVNSRPPNYEPLQKSVDPAKTALENEKNPKSVIAPQGYDASSLYVPAGDKPKDRKENIKKILKEHEKFMGDRWDNNEVSAEEKRKYASKEDFLKAYKGEEVYFKSFEALEKSTAWKGFSDKTKELYEKQKDGFPMKIVILPFDKLEKSNDFMKGITNQNYIKPMPPAAKKEAKKTEAEKPAATPLPGATGPK